MTNRDRERETLDFGLPGLRGSVEETFYPWDLTARRFYGEGLPEDIYQGLCLPQESPWEKYFKVSFGKPVMDYEKYFSFDPLRRIKFLLPFGSDSGIKIHSWQEWETVKQRAAKELEDYFNEEYIKKAYGCLAVGHRRGDYPIRLSIEGFFWIPRELLGVEEHLYAFYDEPELIHDMNRYALKIYETYLPMLFSVIQPDVVYIQEDLSGKNGPMISPECFREFIGNYYRELIPMLKEHGCGNVFVDTDGDFMRLIPEFIAAGVDGFLPMDVNAGMDIVAVRREYPGLKFIGGFNKLKISEGPEAIDLEFERIGSVIRQGGYIPGADHQVAPSASLDNYRYYIKKLHKAMALACTDIKSGMESQEGKR